MSKIEIICKNTGIRKEYPIGTTLAEIAKDQNIQLEDDILAARVNNSLRELSFELFKPKTVEFIDIHDPMGYAMYMRSMIFIMFKAARDLWPESTLKVEHTLPLGTYCELIGIQGKLSLSMVIQLRKRVQEIIDEDLPITRRQIPTTEAIEVFKQNRLYEKVLLFQTRNELYTSVYSIGNVSNYFYGYLVPSTGYIKHFHIDRYFGNGLIITEAFLPKYSQVVSTLHPPVGIIVVLAPPILSGKFLRLVDGFSLRQFILLARRERQGKHGDSSQEEHYSFLSHLFFFLYLIV